MNVISFASEPQQYWQVAGWAFRQFLDDLSRFYADASEVQQTLEVAKLYDALSVYALKKEMDGKVIMGIRQVAAGILSGQIESSIHAQPYGDIQTQDQYRSALRELLSVAGDPALAMPKSQ